MLRLLDMLFNNRLGRLGLGVAMTLALLAGFVRQQQTVGAHRAIETVEKANVETIDRINRAAARSADVGVRRQRDPSTRDEAPR